MTMRELSTSILIVGGGTGGTAAALSCARLGVPCILTEPTDWIGGQLTSQGVPPDENQWVEEFGATSLYQTLRERVRAASRRAGIIEHPGQGPLNPGGGWVSRLCAEPSLWHAQLRAMLAEADPRGLTTLLLHHEPIAAEVTGDRVNAVTLRDVRTGTAVCIRARIILDATETGELYELARVEHSIGAEHQQVFGELHGRTDFNPALRLDALDQQACSWCFALEHRPGENHVAAAPAAYAWWRSHVPAMSPAWTGPLFSWTVPSHNPEGRRTFNMVPWPDEPAPGTWEMWRYRRIVDASRWPAGVGTAASRPDVTVINMVQMDYWQRPLLGVEPADAKAALAAARQQSLCWLHWMQTEAPRHDGPGLGYPGLKLRGDELGTADGLAKAVYIREPRRLVARTIVTEAHVGTEQRKAEGRDREHAANWDATPFGTAHRFEDSVGIGHYMIDLHPSCAGRNNVYVPAAPFRVPMGALIPVRVRNLLAAGKGIGVTHITNGAYRMHHVEWNIGESAGALAAFCINIGADAADIHADPQRVADVQSMLAQLGIRLAWPWEL